MLSGPAILRISVLLLLAGALAALAQYLLPGTPAAPPAPVSQATAPASPPPTVRRIAPASPAPAAAPAPVVVRPPPAPVPERVDAPAMAPDQSPRGAAIFAELPSAPEAEIQGETEIAGAERTEGPAALALVDLNTASAADLNRLRGGGNIGRAIIAKRPYAAVSDLLTKRVLSRSTFERIREQVTVR